MSVEHCQRMLKIKTSNYIPLNVWARYSVLLIKTSFELYVKLSSPVLIVVNIVIIEEIIKDSHVNREGHIIQSS